MKNFEIKTKKMDLANIEKKLTLEEMENVIAGDCTKTSTKILVGVASAAIGAATGGIGALLFVAWDLYEVADTMTSGECQNW